MTSSDTFPVVGIGASAGGLDAMCRLFDVKPGLHDMAFIVVQHLDPKGESHLVDLLGRHSALTVRAAEDGLRVQPGFVYVCVPNRDLVVEDGCLRLLTTNPERGRRRPIDRLFDALASEFGDRAVAIVLSGTAADGSRGISAIKSAGGVVLVQEPGTAEFDGMPMSALATGLVDAALAVEDMPALLERLSGRPEDRLVHLALEDTDSSATLGAILEILRDRFGYDFADYKRPTLIRRTQRRMSLSRADDYDAYVALVREDADEAAALFRDLMINVSSFFRDPEVWNELTHTVIDPLIAQRADGDSIRVWSAGCATGEEAYTIGILLLERIEAAGKRITPQIFATDVSDSLEFARVGSYPDTVASEVSPERLERFFDRTETGYTVKRFLRDLVVFARHNVIRDPPFSRLDLVCCRNMLIYIEPETQRRILWLFNFALHDGSTLVLGSAETVGAQTDLFIPISERGRIFRSRRSVHAGRFSFPRSAVTNPQRGLRSGGRSSRSQSVEVLDIAHRALLDRFAPPSVLIDADCQVLTYHGDTSPYLVQPGGEPTRDLLALVPAGLRPALRQAVHEATGASRRTVTTTGHVMRADRQRGVSITVGPTGSRAGAPPLLLVSFGSPTEAPAEAEQAAARSAEGRGQTIEQLETELRQMREELRQVSEQYDRLVEEYSTFNEETLSINEELQSANEELETSKEELQSLNEELNTLNDELRSKVAAVELTNNDLNNLLASTEIATLFLAIDARIRWFTPAIRGVLRLLPSDVGRPIRDLSSTVTGSNLEGACHRVLETLVPVETEVMGEAERCFIRRVLPYRTADNRIDGVVVTFIDITEHKRQQQQRERLMHELSHRIKNTLATVQAIVQGMGRRCESLPEFLEAFEPRLAALARAQSLLTLPEDEPIGLRRIISRECAPYVGERADRVRIEGAPLILSRRAAVALELVFHELVTNAVKYGALSNDTGLVTIRWNRIDDRADPWVRLHWIESGGPAVPRERESGFGSLLIDNSLAHDLAGSVNLKYEPSGLECTLEFPFAAASPGDAQGASR